MQQSTVTWVLDYGAVRRSAVAPRRLHRRDCTHASATADWRRARASPEELRTLRECNDWQRRDAEDRLGHARDEHANVAADPILRIACRFAREGAAGSGAAGTRNAPAELRAALRQIAYSALRRVERDESAVG